MRICLAALLTLACSLPSIATGALQVGVAKVDITPDYPIRLCGYFARKTQSDGVEQHVFAKALAISADGSDDVALLVTVDSTGVPANVVEDVARRLHDKAHVARERLVISSSHSHCAPWLGGYAINIFGAPVSADQQATVDRYTKETTDHLEQVALAAIADRKPGKLAWGVGEADFATNRRTKGGPVDHTMPMLLATDVDGKPRAIVCNYACHNTTLGPDFNKVCGDWAGYAQAEIERRHPGVVAMITLGCAGDANPMPRGKLEQAQKYGAEIADAADKVLAAGKLTPLTEPLATELKHIDLPLEPLPTKEQWEALAKRPTPDGGNARIQLAKLNRGEKLDTSVPYVIETWTFGKQLAMVFLDGEVVVDYDLRLKHDFDASRLWISAYCNDVPCYIPSRRILAEGGYEGGGAMIYYAKPAKFAPAVEDDIIHTVHTMLPIGFRSEQSLKEYPPPKTPKQEQQSLRLPDGLKAELVVAEPLVTSPVAIDWGLDGRLWVCEMNDYPNGRDENLTPGGQIKVLESTKHDGHYDKATVFLDHLRMPTGVMVYGKGILVCAAPDIIYAEDTKGSGKADLVKVLYTGFGPKNEQWLVNGLSYGLDNWIYGASSIANDPITSTITGQTVDLGNRDFRIHPETGAFEPAAGRTQYCRPTDDAGDPFGNDNSNLLWNYPLPEHYLRRNPHAVAPRNVLVPAGYDFNQLYPIASELERFNTPDSAGRTTSACGPTIYRDELLSSYYGNAFGCEPANNLMYHLVLEPKGVTFTGHRAAGEEHRDFFTSTDNWFRPVQARTAPDGSLWVVDMYRFVIEHPRWIPPDRMARLDLRAGSDMGRIWRILPKDATARPIPDLSHATPTELAKAMDTPNGTLRDTIQRVLVERRDTSCASTLEELARKAKRTAVRLQALCTLDGLGSASPQLLAEALADKDASVRRHAVRIAEPLLNKDADIAQAVAKLADDADVHVRYQVALSLGEWSDPRAAEALGRLAVANVNDGWFRAAIASSSSHCAVDVLKALIAGAPDSTGRQDLVGQLVATAAADEKSAGPLLAVVASLKGPNGYDVGQFKAIARLLDTLEQRPANPFPAEANDAIAAARKLAADSSTPQPLRIAATSLLARGAEPAEADLKQLAGFLQPQSPAPMQSAATAALARAHGPKPAALLLDRWKSASPSQRTATLNVLVSRPEWAAALLGAIEKGKVQLAEVPVSTRVRLSHLPDDALHHRADAIFSTARPSTRQEVLKKFEPVLSLKGDAAKGRETFIKTCTPCHLLEGQGHAVGPDLSALTDRSPRALMIAILDPNAAVDGKFVSYDLFLKDGRSLSGIVESETASSVTLVQPTGIKETLPRTDLVKFHSSGLSLMPEGLETGMTQQDLADLIEYVGTVKHQSP